MAISQEEMQALVNAAAQAAVAAIQATAPVAQPSTKSSTNTNKRHSRILNTFKKRGYKNVVLRDSSNPSADFNVRPYGKLDGSTEGEGWLQHGRRVKKGEKSVMGLFHVTQTEALPVNKPAAEAIKSANGNKPTLHLNAIPGI